MVSSDFADSAASASSLENVLTPRCRRLLRLAAEEAQRFHEDRVLPEHLLLGLLALNEGGAVEILRALGTDLDQLRTDLEQRTAVGESQWSDEVSNTPIDPSVQKIWQTARELSQKLGHENVGTGHVLLALLLDEDHPAARALQEHGVSLQRVQPHFVYRYPLKSAPDGAPASQAGAPGSSTPLPLAYTAEELKTAAEELAFNAHHEAVGTEDILWAILDCKDDPALYVLLSWGLSVSEMRMAITSRVRVRAVFLEREEFPWSPAARRVLQYAEEEARALQKREIGTPHILLGLLREPEGIAAEVLRVWGVTLAWAHEQVRALS
jgi:ATP-dependent Clp protease ATP-binding subunit ClpA